MADLSKIPLFRMVHIENIKHILSYGITHKESPHANPHFVPIGDSSIITTRNSFVLENGNTIGDYIPFYFASRTPMLYVIQNGFNGVKTNNPDAIKTAGLITKAINQGKPINKIVVGVNDSRAITLNLGNKVTK